MLTDGFNTILSRLNRCNHERMSDIDSVIESLRANADALKETASIAEAAHLPEEDRLAIERARETLQAIMEKAYDLAMERGLDRNIPPSKVIPLKKRDQT